jgi:muramoyltetrapeptide carboxypeptidase
MKIKPLPLQEGDRIGVFIPSSPVKEPFRANGLKRLEALGYVPVEVDRVLSRVSPGDFLAKTPEESFQQIRHFFAAREIRALWAGRGGYGSNHLLPLLTGLEIAEPKVVIGSSDASYLLWYLLDRMNLVVFYGPMVYSALAENRFDQINLKKILSGNYDRLEIPGKVILPGQAKGMVTGGCLSNLVSLIGTPYMPRVDRCVLLIEDVAERPYRLDRMFWQLANTGIFAKIKGLLLGEFPGCFKDEEERENFLQRVRDYVKDYSIPVIYDLPLGHAERIHTLPLGVIVEVDTAVFPGLTVTDCAA